MLPKVSAALSKFVPPIAASSRQTAVGDEEEEKRRSFQRFKDQEKKHEPEPEPPPKPDLPPLRLVEEHEQPPSPETPGLSVAQHFLHLLSRFNERRGILFRWFGQQSYLAAEHQQKKSVRLRKGIMLDEKID